MSSFVNVNSVDVVLSSVTMDTRSTAKGKWDPPVSLPTDKLNTEDQEKVKQLLFEYSDVFSRDEAGRICTGFNDGHKYARSYPSATDIPIYSECLVQ